MLGWDYWSLSACVKRRVKNAVSFISDFEDAVSHFATTHRVDGIVCGHIHTPAIKRIRQVDYYNCGDWVESGTALVGHRDGTLELTGPSAIMENVAMPVLPDEEPAEELALTAFAANVRR